MKKKKMFIKKRTKNQWKRAIYKINIYTCTTHSHRMP